MIRPLPALLITGAMAAACNAPFLATATPTSRPTVEPSVAPSLTPWPSPRPSSTRRPLPPTPVGFDSAPWPTFAVPSPSPSPTAALPLDCKLEWQSPGSGIEFKPGDHFSTGWKVTNTGTESWTPGAVEFTYVGGARLHRDPTVQLEGSVPPGDSVVLTAEMRAPQNPTKYTTYWGLRRGDAYFCRLTVWIYVE